MEPQDVPMATVEAVNVDDMTSADYYFDSYAHFGTFATNSFKL